MLGTKGPRYVLILLLALTSLFGMTLLAQTPEKCVSQEAGGNALTTSSDRGGKSLTGSTVVFYPAGGGDTCWSPGASQTFCFITDSYSPDYEYVYSLWLSFPADWTVTNVTVAGTPTCDNGSWGSFSWSNEAPNLTIISHPRYQGSGGAHCTAMYLVTVTTGAAGPDAQVSWYWDGDGYAGAPHNPCSNDNFTPPSMSAQPCDEAINPRATIPSCAAGSCDMELDDGTIENNIGLNGSGVAYQYMWFNRFTPDAGCFPFNITSLEVLFGVNASSGVNVGDSVELDIYTDADGDPTTGATFVAAHTGTVQFVDDVTWSVYTLATPVTITGPGDVLVGVVNRWVNSGVSPASYPSALDQTASQGRSWVASYSADPGVPPVIPSDGLFGTIDSMGFPGNWMIRAVTASAGCTDVIDQPLSTVNTNAYVDQDFSDMPTYSSYLADDFTNSAPWTIDTITIPGNGWNGFSTLMNATSLNWAIYADNAGIPAGYPGDGATTPQWSLSLPPGDASIVLSNGTGGFPSNVEVTLSAPPTIPAGTWWLIFWPVLNYTSYGQYGRQGSDTTNGYMVKFINPGGGFGYGTAWQDWTILSGVTLQDMAFSICATAGTGCTLAMAPATLPDATVGLAYSQTVTASGGTAPYTYEVTSGVLPAGLTLDTATGVISGTPTSGGSYTFTITATDSAACTGTITYTINFAYNWNMSVVDDSGRSSACLNTDTGYYAWTVLTGFGAGTYVGHSNVTFAYNTYYFQSGKPSGMNMKVSMTTNRASGTYISPPLHERSICIDSDITDNPSCP